MELNCEGGPPLGTVEDFEYTVERYQLTPGDLLLLYTDGVTEAENPEDLFYTAARLKLLLRSARTDSAKALVESVYEDLHRFAAGAQADDITRLAVRWISGEPVETNQRIVISTRRLRGSDTCGPVGTAGSRSPRPATDIESGLMPSWITRS
jgi:Stage II sporulation protein E (SpoIIE)